MRRFLLLLLLLLTACSSSPVTVKPRDYQLNTINTPKGIALKVNDFYSVYYIYMYVIRAMELDASLSREETVDVINSIINTLKQGEGIQIVIPHYHGGNELRATLRTDFQISKDNIPNLLLVTNYEAKLKRAVEGDMQKDAYATYFIISGDKLIKHQLIDNPKSQEELNAMSMNELTNYYLLDEDSANDLLGKTMLERALPNEHNVTNEFLMHLTLSEYDLLEGDALRAQHQLGEAETIVNAQNDAKLRQRMSHLYSYASDIVYYYNKYHR